VYQLYNISYRPNGPERLGAFCLAPAHALKKVGISLGVGLLIFSGFSRGRALLRQAYVLHQRCPLLLLLPTGFCVASGSGLLLERIGRASNPAPALIKKIAKDAQYDPGKLAHLGGSIPFDPSNPGPLFQALCPILGPFYAAYLSLRERPESGGRHNLDFFKLTSEQMDRLVKSPDSSIRGMLAEATSLTLRKPQLDDEGIHALVALLNSTSAEMLRITGVTLTEPQINALLDCRTVQSRLKTIFLPEGTIPIEYLTSRLMKGFPVLRDFHGLYLPDVESARKAGNDLRSDKRQDMPLTLGIQVASDAALRAFCEAYFEVELEKWNPSPDIPRVAGYLAEKWLMQAQHEWHQGRPYHFYFSQEMEDPKLESFIRACINAKGRVEETIRHERYRKD
jgi:hypothetical protein